MTYLEFLKAYKQWLDAGAPDKDPFHRNAGLCYNAEIVADGGDIWDALHQRLSLFYSDAEYPFYDGEWYATRASQYGVECINNRCHLNPKRIAFVDAEIERLS